MIGISDRLQAVAGDLVRLVGSVEIRLAPDELNNLGLLFSVEYGGYIFAARIADGVVSVRRNSCLVILPLESEAHGTQLVSVVVRWTPELLHVSYVMLKSFSKIADRATTLRTTFTAPPPSLITLLRKQNLLDAREYESEEAFRSTVFSILDRLQGRIGHFYSTSIFWNLLYSNGEMIAKLPKSETDSYAIIQAILIDQMLRCSIGVVPDESPGSGSLDFVLTANIRNNGWGRVCLLIRNAHSPVLSDGLMKQLPRFMDSQNAEFGIFLVMWYGTYFSPSHAVTATNLEAELVRQHLMHHSPTTAKRISFFCIDLTLPVKAGRNKVEVHSTKLSFGG